MKTLLILIIYMSDSSGVTVHTDKIEVATLDDCVKVGKAWQQTKLSYGRLNQDFKCLSIPLPVVEPEPTPVCEPVVEETPPTKPTWENEEW
jgi:hypothetical protein